MPTVADAVAVFLALHLIAGDHPPTPAESAWMTWNDNGSLVWETGRALGLVGPRERRAVDTPPLRGGEGRMADHRSDLRTLRERAHPPAVVPMRMPNN